MSSTPAHQLVQQPLLRKEQINLQKKWRLCETEIAVAQAALQKDQNSILLVPLLVNKNLSVRH